MTGANETSLSSIDWSVEFFNWKHSLVFSLIPTLKKIITRLLIIQFNWNLEHVTFTYCSINGKNFINLRLILVFFKKCYQFVVNLNGNFLGCWTRKSLQRVVREKSVQSGHKVNKMAADKIRPFHLERRRYAVAVKRGGFWSKMQMMLLYGIIISWWVCVHGQTTSCRLLRLILF